jgi:hypothetical protein
MARAQKEERAGKDIRSPRLALVSFMVSSIFIGSMTDSPNHLRACRRTRPSLGFPSISPGTGDHKPPVQAKNVPA